MKKNLFRSSLLLLSLGAFLIGAGLGANAQTNEPVPVTDPGLNNSALGDDFSLRNRFIAFEQGMSGASNVTLAVYPSYAPDLVTDDGEKAQWGAGAALTYSFKGELGQFLFTGLRVDYLGNEFWAPSINGGLKADVQIFGKNFTPFAYTGVVVPLKGAGTQDGEFGMLYGAGVKTELWRGKLLGKDATLGIGAAVEKWDKFNGQIYHIAPVLTIKW